MRSILKRESMSFGYLIPLVRENRPFFSILGFPVAYLYLFIFSTLALLAYVYRILWPGKSPTHFMAQSMALRVHQYLLYVR